MLGHPFGIHIRRRDRARAREGIAKRHGLAI